MQKAIVFDDRRGGQTTKIVQVAAKPLYAAKQVFLTQAEFDALVFAEPDTLYFIIEG